ncbi:MAG TPA: asparagine synthase-related protein, partial [Gemmatimonadaceae bacterium]|nr:asparagine synthase-related protein [Gemmatimonadaceae bacterium]
MLALLSRSGSPDEARARRAIAAVPYPTPDVQLIRVGACLLGIANRPGFVREFISSDGPIRAALSGVLENAAQLYDEVASAGQTPASHTPADVVVAAFRAYGLDAPNRMRGPFSACITDGHTLWCFRDHIGFRPLFYRNEPNVFAAASESRQVAVATSLREEPDLDVLEAFLYGAMPSDLPAALRGVSRLAQATTLTVSVEKAPSLHVYWRPIEIVERSRGRVGDVREQFLAVLEQASVRCLDENDLILLSGGLDSTAIGAYVGPEYQRRHGTRMTALTAVFPELPAVDELSYTQTAADAFAMDLKTFRPSARALDNVDEWCRRLGTPVPILSIPEVSAAYNLSHSLGCTNVITGEFAEFTYGSPKHAMAHLLSRARLATLVQVIRSERKRGDSIRSIAIQLAGTFVPGSFANWYIRKRGYDIPQRIPDWLDANKVNERPFRHDLLPPSRDRWRRLQIGGTWGATVMAEADAVCAAMAGVTIRRPFADIDLWEFFLGLPVEVKFPELKYKSLPKRLLKGVIPDAIVNRKYKTAFDAHVLS